MNPCRVNSSRQNVQLPPLDENRSLNVQVYLMIAGEMNLALRFMHLLYEIMNVAGPFVKFFAMITRCGVELLKREVNFILKYDLDAPQFSSAKAALFKRYKRFCQEVDILDLVCGVKYSEKETLPLWFDSDDPNSYIDNAKDYQMRWSNGTEICLTSFKKCLRIGERTTSYQQLTVSKLANIGSLTFGTAEFIEMFEAWCRGDAERIKFTPLNQRGSRLCYYSPLSQEQLIRPVEQYISEKERATNQYFDYAEVLYNKLFADIFEGVSKQLNECEYLSIMSSCESSALGYAPELVTPEAFEEAKLDYMTKRINAEFVLKDYLRHVPTVDMFSRILRPFTDEQPPLEYADLNDDQSFISRLRNEYDQYVMFKVIPSPVDVNLRVFEFAFPDGSGAQMAIFSDSGYVDEVKFYNWPESKGSRWATHKLKKFFRTPKFYLRQCDDDGSTPISQELDELVDLVSQLD